ncbi:GGDEF domain-containing protein [Amycolatopsis jiangsuensis]|uniref:Diguanylate cyclase (GGDEF)-like protein n=2 Tax=Amycolatopsis jiangsuensis TaxID=1181879 RepID=A0A840ISP2_9PSEU|nr:GGDEF domain-containing protein [Amycolatopsis jiangsuensis]MBB4684559.1 diguanylate cyclase (GGDEF)-like protein [Amycolatopsis jiangsuensis]
MTTTRAVRFAFQPMYSLHTGGVVAYEALARPGRGTAHELLAEARRAGRLTEVDLGLAAAAVRQEAGRPSALPLHLNLSARTLASAPAPFDELVAELGAAGRRTRDVVLEIGPPFTHLPADRLLAGMRAVTELGFRLALDGLGRGDLPLALLAQAPVDLVKLDRSVLRGLPGDPAAVAVVEALLHFTTRTNIRLVATGIETGPQLDAAQSLGVRIAQGNLLAPPAPHRSAPVAGVVVPEDRRTPAPPQAPRIADFLRPATTLPGDATCDDVREVLAAADAPSGVVGVDQDNCPQWSVDRTRFLVAVTGPYGHALHAKRPAARLADKPHTIEGGASALEFLELVTDADWGRTGDDVVVVDARGRCLGVVLVTEVVRGVAEAKVEEAVTLSPLTRLPGSEAVARDVERRIATGQQFVVAWLDVDSFKAVNDNAGFAAGDDLIRTLGETLTGLSQRLSRMRVSHVGGDDFLIVCDVDEIGTVAAALLDTHWSAEGMPVTVSLATLVCGSGTIASYRDTSRLLAPLKKRAKAVPGSSWVLSRPGSDRVEVLRGIGRDVAVGRPA